jgi:hypothetical protein
MKGHFKECTEDEVEEASDGGRVEELVTDGFERGSILWAVASAFSKAYEGEATATRKKARQRQMSKTARLTGLETVSYEIDALTRKLIELNEKIKQADCRDDIVLRHVACDIHEAGAIALDAITSNLELWEILKDDKTFTL